MNIIYRKSGIRKLLVVLLIISASLPLYAQDGVQTVTPDEFFAALENERGGNGGIILDIRTPREFNGGHAPGALNIDFYESTFSSELDELDREESYFIYCNSGNRSGRSLDLFRQLGFSSVYDLAGGWSRNSEQLSAIKE